MPNPNHVVCFTKSVRGSILMETPAVGSTLSAARILLCSGVGLVVVVRISESPGKVTSLRHRVARSASSVVML